MHRIRSTEAMRIISFWSINLRSHFNRFILFCFCFVCSLLIWRTWHLDGESNVKLANLRVNIWLLDFFSFDKSIDNLQSHFLVNCGRALIESHCGMDSATVQMRSSVVKLLIGVLVLVIACVAGQQNSIYSVSIIWDFIFDLVLFWSIFTLFLNYFWMNYCWIWWNFRFENIIICPLRLL